MEFHRRLALPTSCLVLALVGIPLGLSSKKGGKSTGFVLTILLVFAYYLISLMGISFGRGGKLPPGLGVWMSDIIFFVAGLVLLWRVDRQPLEIGIAARVVEPAEGERCRPAYRRAGACAPAPAHSSAPPAATASSGARFPLILDDLVLRDFSLYLGLILSTFLMLTLVFTFFELLSDIVRNRTPLTLVADYLVNVTPSMLYIMTPLSVLLAVLITFGLMQKSSELTAIKASGISLYRMVLPVMLIAAVIASALFVFDQVYIPHANKRQETLRNPIKGKPAADLSAPRSQVDLRRARRHLLLRVLRSRPEPLRQRLGVLLRPQDLSVDRAASMPRARTGPTHCRSGSSSRDGRAPSAARPSRSTRTSTCAPSPRSPSRRPTSRRKSSSLRR